MNLPTALFLAFSIPLVVFDGAWNYLKKKKN